jgi:hypothetical protein
MSDQNPARHELNDLRQHLERAYQGALESQPEVYTATAKTVFADYVIARVQAYAEAVARKREVAARIDELDKFSDMQVSHGDSASRVIGLMAYIQERRTKLQAQQKEAKQRNA